MLRLAIIDVMHQQRVDPEELSTAPKGNLLELVVGCYFQPQYKVSGARIDLRFAALVN